MLRGFPDVHRFESTSDVLQNAILRLLRALRDVQPHSMREFFGLAGILMRRELLDLKKHYCGPEGEAAHRVAAESKSKADRLVATDTNHEPEQSELEEWTEFHRQIDALPEEAREVIDLHFYQGLSMPEVAEVIGVNVRTAERRWNAALARLRSVFHNDWPQF
jgi:RNA polymerase sigma-70 factor (ECF subfamily)